jgi:hypothetical protein
MLTKCEEKVQTMINKALHKIKLKIEKHKAHLKPEVNSGVHDE